MPDYKILRDFFDRHHHKLMESIHSAHLCACFRCRFGRMEESNGQAEIAIIFTFKGGAMKQDENKKEVYVCPMHPDVKSDKPGKCPKCGMNLEPKK